jgi:hypothetical protein
MIDSIPFSPCVDKRRNCEVGRVLAILEDILEPTHRDAVRLRK